MGEALEEREPGALRVRDFAFVRRSVRRSGLRVCFGRSGFFGLPGLLEQRVQSPLAFIRQHRPDSPDEFVLVPLHGIEDQRRERSATRYLGLLVVQEVNRFPEEDLWSDL